MTSPGDKNKKLCCLSISGKEIAYTLCRSRRRTLQIAIKDSLEVNVSAPRSLPEQEIEGFIRKKSGWILQKLSERRPVYEHLRKRGYEAGQEFLFLGRKYPLDIAESAVTKPSVTFNNEHLIFQIPPNLSPDDRKRQIKDCLTAWYRLQAKEILGSRLFHFSRIMGLEPRKIVIKTQKNLWGSCSSHTRSIQLNWKLVLAPLDVLDYVIVHELSHLAVPNHSRRFWQKVEKTLPDYRPRQQWLKDNHYEMALP